MDDAVKLVVHRGVYPGWCSGRCTRQGTVGQGSPVHHRSHLPSSVFRLPDSAFWTRFWTQFWTQFWTRIPMKRLKSGNNRGPEVRDQESSLLHTLITRNARIARTPSQGTVNRPGMSGMSPREVCLPVTTRAPNPSHGGIRSVTVCKSDESGDSWCFFTLTPGNPRNPAFSALSPF